MRAGSTRSSPLPDPRVALAAPRIVAAGAEGLLGRYEAKHSPLDRGPLPARVVPKGRVPFVPGAALVMRTELARFDETLTGGEDVDLVWRLTAQGHDVRYEPAAVVEHRHRTRAREWLARRAYYGRTAAPLARRHPGHARPLQHLALDRRRLRRAGRAKAADRGGDHRDGDGAAGKADRRPPPCHPAGDGRHDPGVEARRGRARCGRGGRSRSSAPGCWPRRRSPPARRSKTLDAVAYGAGVWHGCLRHRTIDPLLPDLSWRMLECDADALVDLAAGA